MDTFDLVVIGFGPAGQKAAIAAAKLGHRAGGMLKILVHAESRELLGVHMFGTTATELVHIGQTVMGCGGTVDYLVDAVSSTRPWPSRTRWPRWTR